MSYLGDFALGATLDFKFATVDTSGAPTTLAGTPVISAYPDNSLTQLTAGITLTVDFDGVTGLHNVRVVATSGNGYATATNYAMVITTGTVGGTSVVGYVVAHFSIENRSGLRPTTAGRTLDVSATGEAGVDWANVGSPTTSLALTGTTIATTQKVDVETIKTNPVVNAGTVTFPTTATLASTTNITAGTITTVSGNVTGSVGSVATGGIAAASFAAGAIDAAAIAANAIGASEIADGAIDAATFAAGAIDAAAIAANAIGASELAADAVAEIADGVWDEAKSGHTTQGTYGENQNAVISAAAIAGTLSTTQMTTDLTNATDDAYNGRTIVFIGNTTAALKGQATNITDYTGATKLVTFTAVTTAPAAGDQFLIF